MPQPSQWRPGLVSRPASPAPPAPSRTPSPLSTGKRSHSPAARVPAQPGGGSGGGGSPAAAAWNKQPLLFSQGSLHSPPQSLQMIGKEAEGTRETLRNQSSRRPPALPDHVLLCVFESWQVLLSLLTTPSMLLRTLPLLTAASLSQHTAP